ncbi:MAG: phytanoyl-CoA dioxygenase family protein [Chloroflexota bacterium]|nr:phytanoyl-CoA dioxygenase family protein [Chloroflexota bacterium]
MTAATLELVSNGYALSNDARRLGRLTPSDPHAPMEALREQFRAQGYLWLKGILDREAVWDFRRRYFAALADTGLLALGSDPTDGIHSGVEMPNLNRYLVEIVRWARYEAFCMSTPIIEFYEAFFGGAVFLHKRKLIRHTVPHDPKCTGAHYDLVYLRGGTDTVCTSWIPIGDCPVEMGGLIYLEGSDAYGRKLEARFSEANQNLPPEERISAFNKNMKEGWLNRNLATLADEIDSRWLVADYEVGDMVVHSAYMIHASTENTDTHGRMRLSTDIRYQRVRDEIDIRWQNHWSFDDML